MGQQLVAFLALGYICKLAHVYAFTLLLYFTRKYFIFARANFCLHMQKLHMSIVGHMYAQ